jgi:hypothetical protein
VTILPPSADDVLSPLRAQVDDLARDLSGDAAAVDQGVLLKQRIFLLHRSVEQHAQLIETLQGEVRSLVDGWKARFGAGGGSSLTPLSSAAIPSSPAPRAAGKASAGKATPPAPAPTPTVVTPARPITEAAVSEHTPGVPPRVDTGGVRSAAGDR